MADFRRWFYALAVVALSRGFTVPVSAQAYNSVYCQRRRSPDCTRRRLRGAGWRIALNCTGGSSHPAGRLCLP